MGKPFLESLLYECMKACGQDDPVLARKAAEEVRRALPGIEDQEARAERDRRIYELRASMTEAALAERFGVSLRHIQRIVREQMENKRGAA